MSDKGWFSTQTSEHEVQVHPKDDLAEHVPSELCWCRPRWKPTWHGRVVIHNSLDGREKNEPDAEPRADS